MLHYLERPDASDDAHDHNRALIASVVIALMLFSSLSLVPGEVSSDPTVVDNPDDTRTVLWDFDDPDSYTLDDVELIGGDAALRHINQTDGDHDEADYSAGTWTNIDLTTIPGSVTIGEGGIEGTYDVQPGPEGVDACLSESKPTDNSGDAFNLFLDSEEGKRLHTIMWFDISTIPSLATISDATLWLYGQSGSRGEDVVFNLHAVSVPFNESAVTWLDSDTAAPWERSGGDYSSYSYGTFTAINMVGWFGIDVADLVEAWTKGIIDNHGLILVPVPAVGDNQKVFQSSDDPEPSENAPRLIVNYSILADSGVLESRLLGPGTNATFTSSSYTASAISHLDDQFSGDSLSSIWTWTNDPTLGDGGYDVGQTRPGWLHLVGESGTQIEDTTVTCNFLNQQVTGGFVASTYLEEEFDADSMGAGLLVYETDSDWIYIAKVQRSATSRVQVVVCESGTSTMVADLAWTGMNSVHLRIERNSTGVWLQAGTDGESYVNAYAYAAGALLPDELTIGIFSFSNIVATPAVNPVAEFDYFTVAPLEEPVVEVRVRSGNSTSLSDPSWYGWEHAQVVDTFDTLSEIGRYLQYRVLLLSPEEWCTPVFSGFACWYEMYAQSGTIETREHVPADFSMWYTLTTNQTVSNGAVRYWYSTDQGNTWTYAGPGGSYSIMSASPSLMIRAEVETYDTVRSPLLHSVSAMHGTAMAYLSVVAPPVVVAGNPFAVTVYAKDGGDITMVHWSGPITLTAMEVDAVTPKETTLAITSATITSGGYVTIPNEMYTVSGALLIKATAGDAYGFSQPMTVSPGPASSLSITPAMDVILEDTQQTYTAEARDAYGNLVPDLEYAWSIDAEIGTLNRYDGQTVILSAGEAGGSGHMNVSTAGLTASMLITITYTENEPVFTEDVPDQTKFEDSGSWTLDLSPYVHDYVHVDSMLRWYVTGEEVVDVVGENRTGNMVMTFSTLPDTSGSDTLTLFVVDPDGLSASVSFVVEIQPVNDWPVLSPIDPLTVEYDHLYVYGMRYYIQDVDNSEDELTLSVDAESARYVSAVGLTLYITYPQSLNGTAQTIVITVSDGAASVSTMIQVTVSDDSVPVVAGPLPSFQMNQGDALVDAFDIGDYFMDPDGDDLTYSFVSNHVLVYISADDMVSFSAPTDWYGTELVVFKATDPAGGRVESASTVVVNRVNQEPVISGVPDLVVKHDLPYEFDLTRYVSDPDNDLDDLHILTTDPHAVAAGLVLTLEYPESMVGETVYLRTTVSDGELSDAAMIKISIGVDAPPTASILPAHAFQEDVPTRYPYSDGLDAYFEDEEMEPLTFQVYMLTEMVSATTSQDLLGEWAVEFEPEQDWHGFAWFVIRATDPGGALVETMVELTVLSVPDAPSLSFTETIEVSTGTPRMVYLYSWITDPDEHGQGLVFSVSQDVSAYSTITEGVLVLEFPDDFLNGGEDRREIGISVTAQDPDGLKDTDTLSVTVVRSAGDGDDQWLVLGLLAMAAVAAGSFIAAVSLRKKPFVIRDIMVIHNDGFLVGRAAEKRAGEIDEDVLSGMLTAVLNFVEDSMAKAQDGLRSFGFAHYKVLVKRGKMTYMALVYEGDSPESIDENLGELVSKVEKIYRKRITSWTGDIDTDFAGIDLLLKAFIRENSRRANGLKAV